MPDSLPLLVFSDVDGTLIDHETYSFDAAKPGLARLKQIGAGVVLASSKTAAELLPLREEIGFPQFPAIVENGAGVIWGTTDSAADDSAYQRIRAILGELPFGFHGFGDMTDEELAAISGLSVQAASLARQRQFSEPGVWKGTQIELEKFRKSLLEQGLKTVRGGRLLSVSFGRTKAMAMAEVVDKLGPAQTIALGDAPNDIEMLQAADRAVLVANPSAPGIPVLDAEAEGRLIRTKSIGPAGWTEAILALTAA